jgi:hypothetical protein
MMPNVTDPALEFAELCEALANQPDVGTGTNVLGEFFGVDVNSSAFYTVLFSLTQRCEQLSSFMDSLITDNMIKEEGKSHIKTISQAFMLNGLQNHWGHSKKNFLNPEHVRPIKFLSPTFRPNLSYPKLSPDEITNLLSQIDDLLMWLKDHQLAEQDFFRAAIIDGVTILRFRLERLHWLGWGYAIDGLKHVMQAYLALHGQCPDVETKPVAVALLQKVGHVLGIAFVALHGAKEVNDTVTFLVDAYGKAVAHGLRAPTISGLLGGP